MTLPDIAIVYLSVGSAVGAHHYFKSDRAIRKRRRVRASVMLVVLLWPPYLLFLAYRRLSNRLSKSKFAEIPQSDSFIRPDIRALQRQLESFLVSDDRGIELFSWRNTMVRYAGLMTAASKESRVERIDFLELDPTPSIDTQHICLNRRNRERLLRHRNSARTEFLSMLSLLLENAESSKKAGRTAIEFAKLLNDEEAIFWITKILDSIKQNRRAIPVKEMENRTWIPQEQ